MRSLHPYRYYVSHISNDSKIQKVKYFLDEEKSDYITTAENVLIENVYHSPASPKSDSVFGFLNADLKNFKIRNVINDASLPLVSYLKKEYTKAEIE